MTNKLTGREALAYMATGGWFKSDELKPHKIDAAGLLLYFDGGLCVSPRDVSSLAMQGITPCPDPTVKVDAYEEKRKGLLLMLEQHMGKQYRDVADHILDFVQDEFQRKEQP